jgi:Protein of unknown function (DUF3179)
VAGASPRPGFDVIPVALILAVLWLSAQSARTVLAQSRPPSTSTGQAAASNARAHVAITDFLAILETNTRLSEASLKKVIAGWQAGYALMLLEMLGLMGNSNTESLVMEQLRKVSGLRTRDPNELYQWVWAQKYTLHPDYAEFKAQLYERIDPGFRDYFGKRLPSEIRLDEIRWGGVRRDGIPPLKNPVMISAEAAVYLADSDIIFGVALPNLANLALPGASGKADALGAPGTPGTPGEPGHDIRAYPKRILAWHEMFKDRIAGRELNGVYCTLCGAMILYDTTVNGVQHELGTSGFLYRSNKLMYDHATKSLWSTFEGKPVVGQLVGKGIALPSLYAVTTTWGEWKKRHPNTTVLSPETGHERDYREGAAYRNYFASDRLMFGVPKLDLRLPNKAEVLALRSTDQSAGQLAIAADYLMQHPVHHDRLGPLDLVVLTDASGANRVYQSNTTRFVDYDRNRVVQDRSGRPWRVEEDRLIGPDGQSMKRLPAHRAFWFGWYSAHPETRLVK